MSSLVLLLLLFLCLHPCDARHIGIIDKENRRELYLPIKADVEREKIRETLTPSMPRSQENFLVEDDARKFSSSSANTMMENDSKSLRKEEDTMGVASVVGRARNGDFSVSSSQEGLQESTKIMRRERQARSMLASPLDDTEESIDSKGNTAAEDIVVMDYAQPHRKPPIHNREP